MRSCVLALNEHRSPDEKREAIVRLLLEFSGLLERDWCRARTEDSQGMNADGSGNPGGGGAGGGLGTTSRRIENMGALLEQLAPLIDWDREVRIRAAWRQGVGV